MKYKEIVEVVGNAPKPHPNIQVVAVHSPMTKDWYVIIKLQGTGQHYINVVREKTCTYVDDLEKSLVEINAFAYENLVLRGMDSGSRAAQQLPPGAKVINMNELQSVGKVPEPDLPSKE